MGVVPRVGLSVDVMGINLLSFVLPRCGTVPFAWVLGFCLGCSRKDRKGIVES